MNIGAFSCLYLLKKDGEYRENISDLSGLSKKQPLLAISFLVILFSLAGIPPLAGFFAKFYVFTAVIEQKMYALAIIGLLTTVISAFYYLRNFYDTSQLVVGEDIALNMFFDEENYLFKLKFLEREVVDTKFGKVSCLKLRPYVQSGRVFSEQESVTLWVSDDANKIPIKMSANLRVGSIDCDLENFRNLQHPFKIAID